MEGPHRFTREAILAIAQQAVEMKTGAPCSSVNHGNYHA